ncbi:MAG: hypothetical protein GY820_47695 [Gammaproteobacteria bacterium]|nr:hypothetical protein [Gammaproteobacteria bacterium]
MGCSLRSVETADNILKGSLQFFDSSISMPKKVLTRANMQMVIVTKAIRRRFHTERIRLKMKNEFNLTERSNSNQNYSRVSNGPRRRATRAAREGKHYSCWDW